MGRIVLKNKIVMTSMTRSRAIGNVPNQCSRINNANTDEHCCRCIDLFSVFDLTFATINFSLCTLLNKTRAL